MPVMSIGMRSGVNWIRLNLSDIVSASLLTSKRLGQAGHAHEQGVPPGEHADRQPLDDLALADDHPADLVSQPGIDLAQMIDRLDIVLAQSFLHLRGHRLRHRITPEVPFPEEAEDVERRAARSS